VTSPRGRTDTAASQCLRVLQLLAEAAPRVVPADDLVARAGYSAPTETSRRRTLRRHVASLVAAGHAIEAVAAPGQPGGYRMTVRDPVLGEALSDDERAALLEAMVALRLGHLARVLGAPPTAPAPAAGPVPHHTLLVPDAIEVVDDALRRRAELHFRYSGKDRVVHPHRLVSRAHEWQLDAFEPAAGKVKTFVLGRMDAVVAGAESGAYPPAEGAAVGGDPLGWQVDPPLDAVVRVDRPHRPEVVAALGEPAADAPAPGSAAVELTFRVTNRLVFQARLLALGPRALLVGPAELRDALVERLQTVARGG
jgi:predicted DNA-binding transcriptional regulator YafY